MDSYWVPLVGPCLCWNQLRWAAIGHHWLVLVCVGISCDGQLLGTTGWSLSVLESVAMGSYWAPLVGPCLCWNQLRWAAIGYHWLVLVQVGISCDGQLLGTTGWSLSKLESVAMGSSLAPLVGPCLCWNQLRWAALWHHWLVLVRVGISCDGQLFGTTGWSLSELESVAMGSSRAPLVGPCLSWN